MEQKVENLERQPQELERRLDLAEASARKVERTSPFVNLRIFYLNGGLYEEAIEQCSEAIRVEPLDAEAYRNRGNACYDLGEYKRSAQDCEEAIRVNPSPYHGNALAAYCAVLAEGAMKELGDVPDKPQD